MPKLRSLLRRAVPDPLWRLASSAYWRWHNRWRHKSAAVLSRRRWQSIAALEGYRNSHLDERCFILGNGPSLRETDLLRLKDEITFGMNRIYLNFDSMGFATTYYVAVNTLVIEQCAPDIKRLSMPKFITWRGRKWLADDPDVMFIDTDYTPPANFNTDATGRLFEGSTVTYVALQLAYFMGFDPVILVGVDHSFSTEGTPNKVVVSAGQDPDHFAPDYFGAGFRWQLPDLQASEAAYQMAKRAFESDGRKVLDATIGGQLEVFPKVDYGSLF